MLDDTVKTKLLRCAQDLREAMQRDDDGTAEDFRSEIKMILGGDESRLEEVWEAVLKASNGDEEAIKSL